MDSKGSVEIGANSVGAPKDNRRYPDVQSLRALQSQSDRRTFFKNTATALLGIGAAVVLGRKAYETATADDPNWGKPIDGEGEREFITSLFGDNKEIILRKKTTQRDDSILGFTRDGLHVKAQAVYGTPYPEGSAYLGLLVKDGRTYGQWYKIEEVLVFDKTQDGILIERKDEKGQRVKASAYVSGNYLRMPRPGEVDTSAK